MVSFTHTHPFTLFFFFFWFAQTGVRGEPVGACDLSRAHTLLYRVEGRRRTGDSLHVPLAVRDQAQTESSGIWCVCVCVYVA